MVARTGGKPRLIVIDPQAERFWEIGEEAGLPILTSKQSGDRTHKCGLWAAPVEPGRAVVVSFFGRLAFSSVSFDPGRPTKADVFFEARVERDPTDSEAGKDPHMVFFPRRVFSFREPA